MKPCILVETRNYILHFVTFSKLRNGNTLLACNEIYGVAISTTFINVRECCATIITLLNPQVFEKPTLAKIKIIAT
jgi:hypothetical protein